MFGVPGGVGQQPLVLALLALYEQSGVRRDNLMVHRQSRDLLGDCSFFDCCRSQRSAREARTAAVKQTTLLFYRHQMLLIYV